MVALLGCGGAPQRAPVTPDDVAPPPAPDPTATTPGSLPSLSPHSLAPERPKCEHARPELGELDSLLVNLPAGTSEDDLYIAALQFIVSSTGTPKVESQDPVAHTIITKPFAGQTLESTCGINTYRVYALRIAVVGPRMTIGLDCQESMGWEAHVVNGTLMPANRGKLRPCEIPTFASLEDVVTPSMVFEGVVAMMDMRRPINLAVNPGWWCWTKDDLVPGQPIYGKQYRNCLRDQAECMKFAAAGAGTCEHLARAYCGGGRAELKELCMGTLSRCTFIFGNAACTYRP